MATPIIPDMPPAPVRAQGGPAYSATADTFVAALQPLVVAINAANAWMASTMATTDGYRSAAADSASYANAAADRAEAVDVNVGAQVALAQAAANNAAASATAAEASPGSIGNLALLHAVALSF